MKIAHLRLVGCCAAHSLLGGVYQSSYKIQHLLVGAQINQMYLLKRFKPPGLLAHFCKLFSDIMVARHVNLYTKDAVANLPHKIDCRKIRVDRHMDSILQAAWETLPLKM